MEYHNSLLADPSTYSSDMDGLCTAIPVRIHCNPELADRGALRAQKDWKQIFGSLPAHHSGTLGPEYNFVSTCFPETLPDRLELVAYIIEVAFLLDDMIDSAQSPMAVTAPYMTSFLQAEQLIMMGGKVDEKTLSLTTKMAVELGQAMMALDPNGAKVFFRSFETWAKKFMRGKSVEEIANFDDYLKHRAVNVSAESLFGLCQFAMGLNIPDDQQKICLELSQPVSLQASLANDLHSWYREHKAAADCGQASVTNAIWVLTEKHGMSVSQAKAVCRQRAKGYAAKYLDILETVENRDDLCQDAKYLLNVLQFVMSGNVVWGLQSPRYNPDLKLKPTQFEVHRDALAGETIRWNQELKPSDGPVQHADVRLKAESRISANSANGQDIAIVRDAPVLRTDALQAPSRYLDSLPAKGIRDMAIDALNMWFRVPADEIAVIKRVVNLLHGASLMLDDIQDGSLLRRGKPAAHIIFGQMQTINSAGYRFLEALKDLRKLGCDKCMNIFCDEVQDLYVGQSHDLAWTCNLECPTEDEYLAMVDAKTAGLFRMLARLLDAKSDSPMKPNAAHLARFMTLLGRLFQIRDDYMNLTSAEKGFCEDLDEGKYSLPLIHALGRAGGHKRSEGNTGDAMLLRNMLAQRHMAGRMSLDQKQLFLELLKARGSLEYTRQAMDALQVELRGLAEQMGMLKNDMLRGLLEVLKV
ncbi:hypothetical protein VTI74DRAFT_7344 [Chaetomium olivicolor]